MHPSDWTLARLARLVDGALDAAGADGCVLAFSGGADSVALLAALSRSGHRPTVLHVDHGLDSGSRQRAEEACALARTLAPGCEIRVERQRIDDSCTQRHGGLEAAARVVRYRALEAARRRIGASHVLTAHHLGDQIETLVLRLGQGTGLDGLVGLRTRRGTILRPLLHRPQSTTGDRETDPRPDGRDLRAALRSESIPWLEDPTNRDLRIRRNLVRRRLLPVLRRPDVAPRRLEIAAQRVAEGAERLRELLDGGFAAALGLEPGDRAASVDFRTWRSLPPVLQDLAVGVLHRAAGHRHGPRSSALAELRRQVTQHCPGQPRLSEAAASDHEKHSGPSARCTPGSIRCSCGGGWSLTVVGNPAGPRLTLVRSAHLTEPGTPRFTYTVQLPGSTPIPEAESTLHVSSEPFQPWMLRRSARRAALRIPGGAPQVTVRNRLPGDTVHPLGGPSDRTKLKKLLIDRKIPANQRDTLPLLCVDGEIAWVPGVAVADPFRLPQHQLRASRRTSGAIAHRRGRQGKPEAHTPSNETVWVFRLERHRSPSRAGAPPLSDVRTFP